MTPSLGDAVWASLLAGFAATTAGALPVVLFRATSKRTGTLLTSFAAGVMLSAAFFSLLAPAIELAAEHWRSRGVGAAMAAAGLLAGGAVMALLNRYAPHEHFVKGPEGGMNPAVRRTTLFVLAIAIHNFPEGFAVGAGVGAGEAASTATALTWGIALQNAPEGFVVAASLVAVRYTRRTALLVASLTGLVEPVGSVFGWAAVAFSGLLLPSGLAFAAGAMVYVVSGEVIPESHRHDTAGIATWAILVGCSVMALLQGLAA